MKNENALLSGLKNYIESIESEFNSIPDERKKVLKELASFVHQKESLNEASNLIFICTHNSRRSHMSQIWAQTAASYYNIPNVSCFSGGTEATAFNPRAVKAMKKAGFEIVQKDDSDNPVYMVKYAKDKAPVKAFSKKYEDGFNPQENFAAVMTCSDADEACPIVFGASERISIPYEDPKEADNTAKEEVVYDERCRQIAVEMFYAFSKV